MTESDYTKLLELVLIRFDTSPRVYQKNDFALLIKLIIALKDVIDGKFVDVSALIKALLEYDKVQDTKIATNASDIVNLKAKDVDLQEQIDNLILHGCCEILSVDELLAMFEDQEEEEEWVFDGTILIMPSTASFDGDILEMGSVTFNGDTVEL